MAINQIVNSTPLSNGEFVSVWTSSGQDGSGNGVFAQKFSGLEQKLAPNFKLIRIQLTINNMR